MTMYTCVTSCVASCKLYKYNTHISLRIHLQGPMNTHQLIHSLPIDLQRKIYSLVMESRKPKLVSDALMEEVNEHMGLLFNILKRTHMNQSIYTHVRYTNVSLLIYYLVWILNDECFSFDSEPTHNLKLLFNNDVEDIRTINYERFLIHDELQATNTLLLIRKCWNMMSVKQRLKSHELLIHVI